MRNDQLDIHIGKRLRSARTSMGLSQQSVADAISVAFQQIQKYERGVNSIRVGRLYELTRILNVQVSYFFSDFEDDCGFQEIIADPVLDIASLYSPENALLVRSFQGIQDEHARNSILSFIKYVADNKAE